MNPGRGFRSRVLGLLVLAATGAAAVQAGPWSRLPEAVARLQARPGDAASERVLSRVEDSVVGEASAGHLAAVRFLLDAYDGLVGILPDGEARLEALHRRVAAKLVDYGDRVRARDARAAGMAWVLAARIGPDGPAAERLRRLLLPPPSPVPGQVWTSPVDGADLVWLPRMRFLMGCTPGDRDCRADEKYLRWVVVPGFWIDRTEVTNGQYRRCVQAGACTPPVDDFGFGDPERSSEPVVGVTWDQAAAYLRWTGRRLPSEAEWERAARGKRADRRFPWGRSRLRWRANLEGTSRTDVFPRLAPVASFPATGWGLFDLAGNAWEWCEDTYHRVLVRGPKDGSAWIDGGLGRVVRGGSWRRTIELARVSARSWHEAWYDADDLGFRGAVGAAGSFSPQDVVAAAEEPFGLHPRPGHELDAARLDTPDRRYLERRVVTWLLVEGKPWEALTRVAVLLARDPGDPVPRDLLRHLETRLAEGAAGEDPAALEEALDGYRAVRGRLPLRGAWVQELDGRLVAALVTAADARRRRGDVRGAAELARVGLSLAPGSRDLQRLVRLGMPRPGETRPWPGDGKVMVWIPPGRYLMGRGRGDNEAGTDEQPAHTVRVKGFWMDRTEVTNAEYRRCVADGACTPPARRERFDDPAYARHPVLWVSWFQARAYALWAGKRLPTEAEWEYAARAGSAARYPWGPAWREGMANGFGSIGPDRWGGSAPVGSFPANRWGLYDMIGNAWEWVEDVYHASYRDAPEDGRAWNQMSGGQETRRRVLRGGSYLDFPPKLRVSKRDHRSPDSWSKTTGFRCVADR